MIIPGRFNGPPGTGNGGYCAGRFATLATDGPAVVTLRQPPPLDTPLQIARDNGTVRILDGERLIAEAFAAPLDSPLVAPVPLAAAEEAVSGYEGFVDHPFPTCYVCGPEHPDGLRIFPGKLADGRLAAPWVVPDDVTEATVWASLDCPGGWSILAPGRKYVLGRIAAVVSGVPSPGEVCVVTSEAVRSDGRKAFVRSALYAPDTTVLGHADAIWIAV